MLTSFLFHEISGENPAAMQTGTSSQRLQSPLPLLAVLAILALVQRSMADMAATACAALVGSTSRVSRPSCFGVATTASLDTKVRPALLYAKRYTPMLVQQSARAGREYERPCKKPSLP